MGKVKSTLVFLAIIILEIIVTLEINCALWG
jgi:hypothetical protein